MRRKPTGLTGQSEHALASEDPLSVLDRRCTSTLRDENGVFHIAFRIFVRALSADFQPRVADIVLGLNEKRLSLSYGFRLWADSSF
jgi:hypothetical protein